MQGLETAVEAYRHRADREAIEERVMGEAKRRKIISDRLAQALVEWMAIPRCAAPPHGECRVWKPERLWYCTELPTPTRVIAPSPTVVVDDTLLDTRTRRRVLVSPMTAILLTLATTLGHEPMAERINPDAVRRAQGRKRFRIR